MDAMIVRLAHRTSYDILLPSQRTYLSDYEKLCKNNYGRLMTYEVESEVHEGAFYQLFVRLSSATSFEPIFGNIDVPLGIY